MTETSRPMFLSRCYVGIALSFLWTSALAQAPPFVPEPGTAKEFVSIFSNPTLLFVQTGPVQIDIVATVVINPDLNLSPGTVVDVTAGQPPSILGLLEPAGLSLDGQRLAGSVMVDAPEVGTIELIGTAAYNGDPRRARLGVSVDVVPEPEPPVFCPDPFDSDCGVVTVPPQTGDLQLVVDYFALVSGADADQLAADIATTIGFAITVVGIDLGTNSYVYELDDGATEFDLDDAINEFLARPDLVENAFENLVISPE